MDETTIADILRQILSKLDKATLAGDSETLMQVWKKILGGTGRSETDVLVALADISKMISRLEAQVGACTRIDQHTKNAAQTAINSYKPLFNLVPLMGKAHNIRASYSDGATGILGLIGASLKAEFREPVMGAADAAEIEEALLSIRSLMEEALLPADLRVSLMQLVDQMLWSLQHPDQIDMQDFLQKSASANVVAHQIQDRAEGPAEVEAAEAVVKKSGKILSWVGKAMNYGIEKADKIEALSHIVQEVIS